MKKELFSLEFDEVMLAEIQSARPFFILVDTTYRGDREYTLALRLPFDCEIYGNLRKKGDKLEIFIQHFEVNELVRGHGVGVRLLKTFTAEAKRNGARYLNGCVSSIGALRTRASVFGADQFIFPPAFSENPPTYESLLNDFDSYEIKIDLNNIDTTQWELPIYNRSEPFVIPSL